MRLGFFGGSFDPPHLGHTAVALAAADAFELTEVVFAPTGRQPLKEGQVAAPFEHRLAMVKLACAANGRLRASAIDEPREDGGANYTVDTLRRLRAEYPGAEIFGVVGVDAYRQMPLWKDPEGLREMAEWVVVTRPGYPVDEGNGGKTHLLATVHVDVSATMLRKRLQRGEDCSEWVAEPVLRYIAEHGLYETSE